MIEKGNKVKLHNYNTIGIVDKLSGQTATVRMNNGMRLNISLNNLEKCQEDYKHPKLANNPVTNGNYNLLSYSQLANFTENIDLHGMSVKAALSVLDKVIDKSLLLNYSRIRVIHGKGNGILKAVVRTYVKNSPILSFADDFMEVMNDGITLIKFL
jgi:DNA mismatch repair protein MutS2